MSKGKPVEIRSAFDRVQFLADRTPETHGSGREQFATRLADYRNGGIFVAHFAGRSEWERHAHGDEIVTVLEGETRVFLLQEGSEVEQTLRAGELIVVPENTWHRFDTEGVKILTVTPRPTDHRVDFPG